MNALLTTFGIDWHLLIAQVANFVILAAALTYFLYKPVLKLVKERQQVVAKGVEDAEKAAAALKEADASVTARIADAEAEASGIVESARGAGAEQRAQIVKDAEARAARIEADADARAKEAAAKARRESEQEIARLAVLAAAKVLAEKA
jgi:F-type H+-transporting ATPase subunit b